jgi:hypothetical protein
MNDSGGAMSSSIPNMRRNDRSQYVGTIWERNKNGQEGEKNFSSSFDCIQSGDWVVSMYTIVWQLKQCVCKLGGYLFPFHAWLNHGKSLKALILPIHKCYSIFTQIQYNKVRVCVLLVILQFKLLCSTISFSSSVVLLSLWHVQCVQPL